MHTRTPIYLLLCAALLLVLHAACSGSGRSPATDSMDRADSLMIEKPDSALHILDAIDASTLRGDSEKARYALLRSMALDKNYIDTTDFSVLQPAIDYYNRHGSPDEKLRTLYYQGRIYQNRQEYDSAMSIFLKAENLRDKISDTLMFAHLLVAQGYVYHVSYQTEDFCNNDLAAAELYKKIGRPDYEISALLKALNGLVILDNAQKADSVLALASALAEKHPEYRELVEPEALTCRIRFGNPDEVRELLSELPDLSLLSDMTKMDICNGFLRLNEGQKALEVFRSIEVTPELEKSLRYLFIKPKVLAAAGDYKDAYQALTIYSDANEEEDNKIYTQKTEQAEQRYNMQLASLREIQKRDRIIWITICGVLALSVLAAIIFYRLRMSRAKQIIAEREKERLQLAAENMRHRISMLKDESESLRQILEKSRLAPSIADVIRERLEMLNGLLAARITDNPAYLKNYEKWVKQITQNRTEFMESTRKALQASHPKFMQYLEEHGLDTSEIDYVCLYAIGLRGKDVGEYTQIKRHYHISSAVRKKLGLSEQDTNLGNYIRRLMTKL